MFDLISPLFAVAGVAAAAVPVVLHLFRRAPAGRQVFSAVRFLKPSPPRATRRSKLQHPLLMLLRMLALILIGLAFGRPFFRSADVGESTPDTGSRRIVILMDAGSSMQRDGFRDAALKTLKNITDGLSEGDVLSVSEFSDTVRPGITARQWRSADSGLREAMLEGLAEAYQPSDGGTQTGLALQTALDELAAEDAGNSANGRAEIVLISDYQRGSKLDNLQGAAWPEDILVRLEIIGQGQTANAGLFAADPDRTGRNRLTLVASEDYSGAPAVIQYRTEESARQLTVDLAPAQRRLVTLTDEDPVVNEVSFDQLPPGTARLVNDPHTFDNEVPLPTGEQRSIRVLWCGTDEINDPDGPRYYAQRVLEGSPGRTIEVLDLPGDEEARADLPNCNLIICSGIPDSAAMPVLTDALSKGGNAVFILRKQPDFPLVEAFLSGSELLDQPVRIAEAAVDDYAIMAQLDYEHPLLRPFAEGRFSDFSAIRFWQHRLISFPQTNAETPPAWTVITSFDSGSPALLEIKPQCGGRLIVSTAGWHPEDSQWALSTRFAPMLMAAVQMAVPDQQRLIRRQVGDSVRPGEIAGAEQWTLFAPDGTRTTSDDSTSAEAAANPGLAENIEYRANESGELTLFRAGRWDVYSSIMDEPDDDSPATSIVVSIPIAEARTGLLPRGQLESLGIPLASSVATAAATTAEQGTREDQNPDQLNAAELEAKQQLWRWFLLGGLLMLIIENGLATYLERAEASA